MKDTDIQIGKCYDIKVGRNTSAVRIMKPAAEGGWEAVSLTTNKPLLIKTAKRILNAHNPKLTTSPSVAANSSTPSQPSDSGKSTHTTPPKRISALGAAVRVLAEAKEPMNCRQLIETMTEKDYWQPKNAGKTPQNTLHAAISKEIKTKGADARFEKVGRGQFTLV